MEKKALQVASVASMIDQFCISNINLLISLGYRVDVVANFENPGSITLERAEDLKKRLAGMGVRIVDVPIPRSIQIGKICQSYRMISHLIKKERYEIVHCHSPIGGAITRLAAKTERKKGTNVIYTAHGFHFFDGAPLKNWMVFYPIERILSKYTDILITINKEDYERAKKHFRAKRIELVPGVGVDLKKFSDLSNGRRIRQELEMQESDILLLSVGELNNNKNHDIVIRAMELLLSEERFKDHLYYLIVGKGPNKERIEQLLSKRKLDKKIKMFGYRTDMPEIYNDADAFVFPSFREGLSVSLMEAMASGLPIACSDIRGNRDLVDEDGGVLFDPTDEKSVANAIRGVIDAGKKMGDYNRKKIKNYDISEVNKIMHRIYENKQ